jgi:hypothetical protein
MGRKAMKGGSANDDLLLAATDGNIAGVQAALAAGADVNAKNIEGETAIILVTEVPARSYTGVRDSIFKFLLSKGANINAVDNHGGSALAYASLNNNGPLIRSLLNMGATPPTPTPPNVQSVVTEIAQIAQTQSNKTAAMSELRALPGASDFLSTAAKYPALGLGGGARRKTRKLKLKSIKPSHKAEKKWDATFVYPDGHQKVVPFGAKGMSDYTKHRDPTRKQRYLKRHSGMGEHWQKPDTPGALSKWVLWNKKTLKASISDYKRRFKL